MPRFIGLWTRLCPNCGKIQQHKTLYVKTEANGRSKWLRIFWACTTCNSLNHVVLPIYRLASVPSELPSPLVACAVDALKQGPRSLDQVVQALRGNCPGVRHVFTSEVRLALKYLKGRRIVTEQMENLTERAMAGIRTRPGSSNQLGACPAEADRGVVTKGLVSVYAQHRQKVEGGDEPTRTGRLRFTPVGVLCISCGYRRIDSALVASH